MFRRVLTVSVMGLLFGACLPGCSSDQEKAADKEISMMNDFADELAKIKSNTDLVSEKSDLEKLGAKMKDLKNETDKLPKPTADEQTALEKKYKPDQDKAQARITDEMKRISKDVGAMAPLEIITDMHLENMGSSPFGSSSKMPM